MQPFIALTDKAWFDFLASISTEGRVDEVNFWSPKATRPMKHMTLGEPVFFRLKHPFQRIAGYAFFAHFSVLELDTAWSTFGFKNGDPDRHRFLERIGGYRREALSAHEAQVAKIGCTILRDAVFWPSERWIPWGEEQGWSPNIVQGKTEQDPARASRLMAEIAHDPLTNAEEFGARFEPLEVDDREVVLAPARERVGQGAFRSRLLDAYGRRCAITGERTEPLLDAAHVQPYLGPKSNHIQNGMLLSKEFHTLFDLGMITVTPEYRVRISQRIRERWSNGRRFYSFDGQPLISIPSVQHERPSTEALKWHNEKFKSNFVA
jgi:putative restriction endonuclease